MTWHPWPDRPTNPVFLRADPASRQCSFYMPPPSSSVRPMSPISMQPLPRPRRRLASSGPACLLCPEIFVKVILSSFLSPQSHEIAPIDDSTLLQALALSPGRQISRRGRLQENVRSEREVADGKEAPHPEKAKVLRLQTCMAPRLHSTHTQRSPARRGVHRQNTHMERALPLQEETERRP